MQSWDKLSTINQSFGEVGYILKPSKNLKMMQSAHKLSSFSSFKKCMFDEFCNSDTEIVTG